MLGLPTTDDTNGNIRLKRRSARLKPVDENKDEDEYVLPPYV